MSGLEEWGHEQYRTAIQRADQHLARILEALDHSQSLRDKTMVYITSDHGGHYRSHAYSRDESIVVPVFIVGPSINAGHEIRRYEPSFMQEHSLTCACV